MVEPITIDLRQLARGLGLPLGQVQAVLELLDEGNTIPFITRYRKDRTGGLDEEQLRQIQARLAKVRMLAERKQTILRTIESQGKLTPELDAKIRAANSPKRLEDLYLPYKPKKQTFATQARQCGLEPLADEILSADPNCLNLDARAADFVDPDKKVRTLADALCGAGHIIAERFSERADLRQRLREIVSRSGRIVCSEIPSPDAARSKSQTPGTEQPAEKKPDAAGAAEKPQPVSATAEAESPPVDPVRSPTGGAIASEGDSFDGGSVASRANGSGNDGSSTESQSQPAPDQPQQVAAAQEPPSGAEDPPRPQSAVPEAEVEPSSARESSGESSADDSAGQKQPGGLHGENLRSSDGREDPAVEPHGASDPQQAAPPGHEAIGSPGSETSARQAAGESAAGSPDAEAPRPAVAKAPAAAPKSARPAAKRPSKKDLRKQQLQERRRKAFRDYYQYSEEIRKIPPHRILAINRGERAKVLRVKLEYDLDAMRRTAEELCVPPDHPHAEFLRGCARDALARLIIPSLEREVRRELTERAEAHAVEVFARNLRKLLLQPPVHGRGVLAVDPGFRSGCKVVALDQFGNVLDHGVLYLVGKPDRRAEAEELVCSLIDRYGLAVIAIGNGTGCREAEEFVSRLIAERLADKQVSYVIVNEAGASVYSASRLGREEFPQYDASIRGAVSIGRRLQDPLSELVKIDPAGIGVGLYQHDVKAKHLRSSLDEVVESCVNYVGVDVNTASPALLRYVSGLNQLTARRIYEYRLEHGPFRSRSQLRQVPGVGETTFVQAAGFLKITSGDNPLDATWIHPESYQVAEQVLAKLGFSPGDLRNKEQLEKLREKLQKVDPSALASELGSGELLLRDIVAQLARPGRDPREDLPGPIFKRGVLKLEDLKPGMELSGTVLNVVDFGAFVDIGMHHSGLVHVSQLAAKYVRDPHEVVSVGDIVRVWVLDVDKQRRRVSLTMVPPSAPPSTAQQRPADRPARPDKRSGQKPPAQPTVPPAERPRRERRERRPPEHKRQPATARRPSRRPPPPREPLPNSVLEGKEPMRSFSDLAQFYRARRETSQEQQAADSAAKPPQGPKRRRKPPPEQSSAAAEDANAADQAGPPQQTAEPEQPEAQAPCVERPDQQAPSELPGGQGRPAPSESETSDETTCRSQPVEGVPSNTVSEDSRPSEPPAHEANP